MAKYNVSGWKKQEPDDRDYSIHTLKVAHFFQNLPKPEDLPDSVDLRSSPHMPSIVDQANLGSCTANAGAGIIDYCEHLTNGSFLTPSRLYLYFNSRIEDGDDTNEDTGSTIRATLKAIANEGAIPETWMPYDTSKYAEAPTQPDYDEGAKYKATSYVLIDQPGMSRDNVLTAIMQQLAGGYILEFGTPVYNQIMAVGPDGNIAMPYPGETPAGGHAMCIVGYDKNHINLDNSKGAFLIRNSWGKVWGDSGYGWLPFGYLADDGAMMSDIWVLVSELWAPVEPAPTPTPAPAPCPLKLRPLLTIEIAAVLLVVLLLIAHHLGII